MDVEIVDALADILPAFAAVEAADNAAMFQTNMQNTRIFGMNEHMAHMLAVRRARVTPFFLHFGGQRLNAGKLLPTLAAVFAAIEDGSVRRRHR